MRDAETELDMLLWFHFHLMDEEMETCRLSVHAAGYLTPSSSSPRYCLGVGSGAKPV